MLSIGLASSTARQALDFEHLYRAADTALYHAKDLGRNRVQVHALASNPHLSDPAPLGMRPPECQPRTTPDVK